MSAALNPGSGMRGRLVAAHRIDWPRVVSDVTSGRGWTVNQLADELDVPRSTLKGWKLYDTEPNHSDGERLLLLWAGTTGRPRSKAPTKGRS